MRRVALLALALVATVTFAPPTGAQQTEDVPRLPAVVVTPSRIEQRVSETPASVTVISGDAVRNAPQTTVDDLLRQVPSFSLFRRSSSLVTHPTAQGVSLRGIGPSGASRALVLMDGVPINDPFGGWVQWSRLAPLGIAQIEVVRGYLRKLLRAFKEKRATDLDGMMTMSARTFSRASAVSYRRSAEERQAFADRRRVQRTIPARETWQRGEAASRVQRRRQVNSVVRPETVALSQRPRQTRQPGTDVNA